VCEQETKPCNTKKPQLMKLAEPEAHRTQTGKGSLCSQIHGVRTLLSLNQLTKLCLS
jgi:hypothetical protein